MIARLLSLLVGWRLYLAIGIVAAIAIGGFYAYARHQGVKSCELKHAEADRRGENIHGEIETKVMRLSDPDLDVRLMRWLRDS